MLIIGKGKYERDLQSTTSCQEWMAAAEAHDKHKGLDRWGQHDHSRQYDYVSIRSRLDELRKLKAQHDIHGLFYTLNEGIHGNMDGMGKAGLYGHARSGTKRLIEDYIDEITHSLEREPHCSATHEVRAPIPLIGKKIEQFLEVQINKDLLADLDYTRDQLNN